MTNAELNEAVARKLGCHCNKPEEVCIRCTNPYSTSIEAAWEILEKMTDWTMGTSSDPTDPKFYCCVSREDRLAVVGKADDIPRAICEAFLKLP